MDGCCLDYKSAFEGDMSQRGRSRVADPDQRLPAYHNISRPTGVLQAIDRAPYEQRIVNQIQHEIVTKGEGALQTLLTGETSRLV